MKENEVNQEKEFNQVNNLNVLKEDFVCTIYNSLLLRKQVGRVNFSLDDLRNVIFTIWEYNKLPLYQTMFDESQILVEGYVIPEMFASLVHEGYTLTGATDEHILVNWSGDEARLVGAKVLSKIEMADITNAIYGSQKSQAQFKELKVKTSYLPISGIKDQFSNGEFVYQSFREKSFPVVISQHFIKDCFLGADHDVMLQEYVNAICTLKA